VSLFDPKEQVPKMLIEETVSARKKCKSIAGAADRRKRCLIEERQDNKKVIHSKASLLAETSPRAAAAEPSLVVPEQ
jgi:hypothetical protein